MAKFQESKPFHHIFLDSWIVAVADNGSGGFESQEIGVPHWERLLTVQFCLTYSRGKLETSKTIKTKRT